MRKPSPAQSALFTPPEIATSPSKAKTTKNSVAPVPLKERVLVEKSGADGQAWRMSGQHAVAYLRSAALAGELLQTEPRLLARAAMAVYYDRKGKAFAWQIRFDVTRWNEVVARLG